MINLIASIFLLIPDGAGTDHIKTNATFYGTTTFPTFNVYLTFNANNLASGPTAPTPFVIGTYYGLGFDDANDEALFAVEIESYWDGVSNIEARIYWTNEPADAIADTETVKWDITYRCQDTATGDIDSGAVGTGTITYTQSGAGVDGAMHISTITIPRVHATQGLAVDKLCGISIKRDTPTDNYSGDAIILYNEIKIPSIHIPNHT